MEARAESVFELVRVARVVDAGMPHHITQRGNRPQPTFFRAEDYPEYGTLMGGVVPSVWGGSLVGLLGAQA